MHKRVFTAVFILNTLFQALLTLLLPIGFGLLFSYLAVSYWGFANYTYAIALPLGAILGIYYMIRFILSTMRAIEAIEEEGKKKTYSTGNDNEEK